MNSVVCKGDQYCIKGSYTNNLHGKEMYRRCESKFEKGCKLLPKSNSSDLLLNGTTASVTNSDEYVCVCDIDNCNGEPGAVVKRQTNHSDEDFEKSSAPIGKSTAFGTKPITFSLCMHYVHSLFSFASV